MAKQKKTGCGQNQPKENLSSLILPRQGDKQTKSVQDQPSLTVLNGGGTNAIVEVGASVHDDIFYRCRVAGAGDWGVQTS